MNKKRILAILCLVAISVGALAVNNYPPTRGQTKRQTPAAGKLPPPQAPGTNESPAKASAPEHVIYRQFFRHLMALKERAKEVERQGRDGKKLRSHYKDKAGLSSAHARALDQIAADCDREVAQMDAEAKAIIDAAHARYPGGRVPAGEQLPTPPPELKKLQRQRDMAVLKARHRLRTTLGEHGFRQIDDFLKLNFAPNVQPAQVGAGQTAPAPPADAGGNR